MPPLWTKPPRIRHRVPIVQHRMANLIGGTAGGCMPVLVLESHGNGISIQELMGCQVLSHPTASVQLHHPIPFVLVMHRSWTSRPFGNLIYWNAWGQRDERCRQHHPAHRRQHLRRKKAPSVKTRPLKILCVNLHVSGQQRVASPPGCFSLSTPFGRCRWQGSPR